MILRAYMYLFSYSVDMLFNKKHFENYVTESAKSFYDINYNNYKDLNMIIFDVDDTITGFNDDVSESAKKFLINLSKKFKVCILTNCLKHREEELKEFFKDTNIFVKGRADKPMKPSYQFLFQKSKIKPENCMMVGDHPFTDIWGAYKVGIKYRVLVEPDYFERERLKGIFFFFKLLRKFERKFFVPKKIIKHKQ